jgi:hypothetical protein
MKRLLALCLILPCGLVFGQYRTEVEVAKSFLRIFQKADTAALIGMLPPPSIFRMTSPEETQGKTDQEILETIKPLRDDLVLGFWYILNEADSLAIDRTKLKVTGQKIQPIVNYPGFYGLSIFFTYGKKKGEFSLGTVYIDNTWYVYAIDQMLGVFSEMVPVKK